MKSLMNCLSRASEESSHYSLLPSEPPLRGSIFWSRAKSAGRSEHGTPVPEGHLPVYVGENMDRFIISADLLNHPVFMILLNKSAQEYGYDHQGVLRIPCHASVFELVLESIRCGMQVRDIESLIHSYDG